MYDNILFTLLVETPALVHSIPIGDVEQKVSQAGLHYVMIQLTEQLNLPNLTINEKDQALTDHHLSIYEGVVSDERSQFTNSALHHTLSFGEVIIRLYYSSHGDYLGHLVVNLPEEASIQPAVLENIIHTCNRYIHPAIDDLSQPIVGLEDDINEQISQYEEAAFEIRGLSQHHQVINRLLASLESVRGRVTEKFFHRKHAELMRRSNILKVMNDLSAKVPYEEAKTDSEETEEREPSESVDEVQDKAKEQLQQITRHVTSLTSTAAEKSIQQILEDIVQEKINELRRQLAELEGMKKTTKRINAVEGIQISLLLLKTLCAEVVNEEILLECGVLQREVGRVRAGTLVELAKKNDASNLEGLFHWMDNHFGALTLLYYAIQSSASKVIQSLFKMFPHLPLLIPKTTVPQEVNGEVGHVSLLTVAYMMHSRKLMKLLFKHHVHPDLVNYQAQHPMTSRPLLHAVIEGNLPMMRLMLQYGANPNPLKPRHSRAEEILVTGEEQVVLAVINRQNMISDPIYAAVDYAQLDALKLLVEQGANVSSQTFPLPVKVAIQWGSCIDENLIGNEMFGSREDILARKEECLRFLFESHCSFDDTIDLAHLAPNKTGVFSLLALGLAHHGFLCLLKAMMLSQIVDCNSVAKDIRCEVKNRITTEGRMLNIGNTTAFHTIVYHLGIIHAPCRESAVGNSLLSGCNLTIVVNQNNLINIIASNESSLQACLSLLNVENIYESIRNMANRFFNNDMSSAQAALMVDRQFEGAVEDSLMDCLSYDESADDESTELPERHYFPRCFAALLWVLNYNEVPTSVLAKAFGLIYKFNLFQFGVRISSSTLIFVNHLIAQKIVSQLLCREEPENEVVQGATEQKEAEQEAVAPDVQIVIGTLTDSAQQAIDEQDISLAIDFYRLTLYIALHSGNIWQHVDVFVQMGQALLSLCSQSEHSEEVYECEIKDLAVFIIDTFTNESEGWVMLPETFTLLSQIVDEYKVADISKEVADHAKGKFSLFAQTTLTAEERFGHMKEQLLRGNAQL